MVCGGGGGAPAVAGEGVVKGLCARVQAHVDVRHHAAMHTNADPCGPAFHKVSCRQGSTRKQHTVCYMHTHTDDKTHGGPQYAPFYPLHKNSTSTWAHQ